jgi:hypothetical protein
MSSIDLADPACARLTSMAKRLTSCVCDACALKGNLCVLLLDLVFLLVCLPCQMQESVLDY